ncbi:MAG: ATP-binding cassette domain-containing protein [Chitinophagaceae bacterium]|nr:MAG: ATP-binding cassette domain-containing protein [Chitinophagaceae bacterium]
MQPLFEIKDLSCAYSLRKEDVVLRIPQLVIPAGKMVFLLGASGCGKSTLLETLGLMNNTVAAGQVLLHAGEAHGTLDITRLWQPAAYRQLNDVRRRHYSFIFQNTNLMENFTAYENVCLSGMIKDNVAQSTVLAEARSLMEKVKLPEREVNLETLAVNLSGGQRQRLAFVRALNNNATVLFGDEPTGNLDEANANELFQTIRANLREGLSAIVVSHDIDLAVSYADQIIVITKDPDKGYGEVHERNVFNTSDWQSLNPRELEAFKTRLRSYYHAANEQKVQQEPASTVVNTAITYRNLFLRKEGRVLLGRQMTNLWVLTVILFFTFLAIGFANGGLEYLDKKMSSAFVRWIKVSIPALRADKDKVKEIIATLEQPENRKTYHYEQVTPFVTSTSFVQSRKQNEYYPVRTRTIDLDRDGMLMNQYVLTEKNFVAGRQQGFRGRNDMAVIVSKRFLEAFGYPEDADYINIRSTVVDTVGNSNRLLSVAMPIPVRTIVNNLPGKYDIIYPMYYYKAYINHSSSLDPVQNVKSFYLFCYGDQQKAEALKTEIGRFVESDGTIRALQPEVYLRADTMGHKPGYAIQVEFLEKPDYRSLDTLEQRLRALPAARGMGERLLRIYDYSDVSAYAEPFYDRLSIYFTDLDRIRDFSRFMLEKFNSKDETYQIEVDTNDVTEKENINFLSNVTYTISILLVVFSTLAVSLFIFNLLKSHLSKVKMNIGTFKAIGLADREARSIYMVIILGFIVIATSLSLLLASITGTALDRVLTMNLVVEKDINYFRIADSNTVLALAVILAASISISWMTIKKILNKTPGDLIYNR